MNHWINIPTNEFSNTEKYLSSEDIKYLEDFLKYKNNKVSKVKPEKTRLLDWGGMRKFRK